MKKEKDALQITAFYQEEGETLAEILKQQFRAVMDKKMRDEEVRRGR